MDNQMCQDQVYNQVDQVDQVDGPGEGTWGDGPPPPGGQGPEFNPAGGPPGGPPPGGPDMGPDGPPGGPPPGEPLLQVDQIWIL